MNPELDQRTVLKFGFYTSIILTVLTLVTFGLAMVAIPPAGPYCPGGCMSYPYSDLLSYYPRDYFWMYFAIFQLFAFIIFITSIHFIVPLVKRMYSFISIVFALIATTVLLIAYFTQFSVVPISMVKGESEGIALITQYNGHGLFIALEELGYITMSIAFMFLVPVFNRKNSLEKSIRIILILQFALMLLSFLFYTIKFGVDRNYRFEVAIITIDWLVTIAIGILVTILIKRKMRSESNKSIVIRFVKAINDHDVNEIVNLMSEGHIFIDATDHKSVGKKGMKEGWEGYYELFPDYQIEISDITENESIIGLFGYAKATYKNLANNLNSNFWRIPASWKAIVENNKVKHWQVYCDYTDLLKIIDKNK